MKSLPNHLTISRFWMTAVMIVCMSIDFPYARIAALVIFIIASITDALDGYLARSRGQVTTLGKLLDPIADKLLTVSAFIALVELKLAPAWMVVVIVSREFVVSALRSIAASRGVIISASNWGKFKTVSQVVAITLLILTNTLERWLRFTNLGKLSLWLVMLLAVGSMILYFVHFFRDVDLRSES